MTSTFLARSFVRAAIRRVRDFNFLVPFALGCAFWAYKDDIPLVSGIVDIVGKLFQ